MQLYILLGLTLLVGYARTQARYKCYSCSANVDTTYGRNYKCLANVTAVPSRTCRKGYYCLTVYSLTNGVISNVRRRCQNPNTDHDASTNVAPTTDGCSSTYSSYNSAGSVRCYYHCTTNKCNNQIPRSITLCPRLCPNDCDIATRKCRHNLKCVQCTSESDPDCERKTKATLCQKINDNYCAATIVTTLDSGNSMRALRTTVTKSCTAVRYGRLPDRTCTFSSNRRYYQPQQVDFVCSSFCKTDGCNIATPATTSNGPKKGLYCVICSQTGTVGSCMRKTTVSRCPDSATHCKSTVRYYISNNHLQNNDPQYTIASIDRECVSKKIDKGCTSTDLKHDGLEAVTCQETCRTDGCNVGWPSRPMCSQCNSSKITNNMSPKDAFDNCNNYPPSPTPCLSPAQIHCSAQATNIGFIEGFPKSIMRGCSYNNYASNCKNVAVAGATIRNCKMSCQDDGCNQGNTFNGQ